MIATNAQHRTPPSRGSGGGRQGCGTHRVGHRTPDQADVAVQVVADQLTGQILMPAAVKQVDLDRPLPGGISEDVAAGQHHCFAPPTVRRGSKIDDGTAAPGVAVAVANLQPHGGGRQTLDQAVADRRRSGRRGSGSCRPPSWRGACRGRGGGPRGGRGQRPARGGEVPGREGGQGWRGGGGTGPRRHRRGSRGRGGRRRAGRSRSRFAGRARRQVVQFIRSRHGFAQRDPRNIPPTPVIGRRTGTRPAETAAAGRLPPHGRHGRTGGSDVGLVQHLLQLLDTHRPHLSSAFLTVDQQDQARHAGHAVLLSQLGLAIDIDLPHRVAPGSQLVDGRFHHLAGTTPVRLKIEQHRFAGAGQGQGGRQKLHRHHGSLLGTAGVTNGKACLRSVLPSASDGAWQASRRVLPAVVAPALPPTTQSVNCSILETGFTNHSPTAADPDRRSSSASLSRHGENADQTDSSRGLPIIGWHIACQKLSLLEKRSP